MPLRNYDWFILYCVFFMRFYINFFVAEIFVFFGTFCFLIALTRFGMVNVYLFSERYPA